jgi:hypothetical protein
MKEIDFLPEWYKSGRRRQISYRTQYFILGGVFTLMIAWNFITSYSTSKARAQTMQMATKQAQAEKVSAKLIDLKNEMNIYHQKESLVKKIDSRINIGCVLAELSYLIDERIVLSKIELISEKFEGNQKMSSSRKTAGAVRAVQSNFGINLNVPTGDVKFKVIIAGVAADASDVAFFIRKMENSPYFCQVVLSFSRNTDIQTQSGNTPNPPTDYTSESPNTVRDNQESDKKIQVSNFEINCYLANYHEE